MTRSALDGIPGLGEARRKQLLKHFGSVKQIRQATLEDLYAVPALPKKVAEAVHEAMAS
jgi:excinuclease ABC subunit C